MIHEIAWTIVDVETTGLSPGRDRVCEVAALRVEPDGTVQLFSSLVNPGCPLNPRASAVNGICDEDVADAPQFIELIPQLNQALKDAVFIAHNAPFDISFLAMEYRLAKCQPPVVPVIDTLRLARNHFRFQRNNLGTVARSLGITVTQQHRAAADVQITHQVFQAMVQQLRKQQLQDFCHGYFPA
jgi:DNA polymerase III epsilon subunit family exonuclease